MSIFKLPELSTVTLDTVVSIFKAIQSDKALNGIPVENIIPVFKRCLRESKGTDITIKLLKKTYKRGLINTNNLITGNELPNNLIDKRREEGEIILRWILPLLHQDIEQPIRFNIAIISSPGQGSSRLAYAVYQGINRLYDKINLPSRVELINIDDPAMLDLGTVRPNNIAIIEGDSYKNAIYPRGDVSHIIFSNENNRTEIHKTFDQNPIIWFELARLDTEDILEIIQHIQNIKIVNPKQVYDYIHIMLEANINPKDIMFILKLASAMDPKNKRSNKIHIIPSLFNEIIDKFQNPLPTVVNIHSLEQRINNIVYGQKEAIETVVKSIGVSHYGLKTTNKPISVMLFVGTTGTGKTLLSTTLSDEIFGKDKTIRLDMGEFTQSHYSAKVFGSPPGYTGFEKESAFATMLKRHKRCTIILDEIEKAHPDILSVFLSSFDSGTITMGNGEELSLKDTIVVITSNALSDQLDKRTMGIVNNQEDNKQISSDLRKELIKYKTFTPEFMNRIDHVILFNNLSKRAAKSIAIKELNNIQRDLSFKGYKFTYDNKLIDSIISRYDVAYGGRGILRLTELVKNNAVSNIITNKENTKITIKGKLNENP